MSLIFDYILRLGDWGIDLSLSYLPEERIWHPGTLSDLVLREPRGICVRGKTWCCRPQDNHGIWLCLLGFDTSTVDVSTSLYPGYENGNRNLLTN